MNKRNRRFEDHLGQDHQGCDVTPEPIVMMMTTEMVLETSVSFIYLTLLIAREGFIKSCRRERFRSYIFHNFIERY
jgi:hypothetical protein